MLTLLWLILKCIYIYIYVYIHFFIVYTLISITGRHPTIYFFHDWKASEIQSQRSCTYSATKVLPLSAINALPLTMLAKCPFILIPKQFKMFSKCCLEVLPLTYFPTIKLKVFFQNDLSMLHLNAWTLKMLWTVFSSSTLFLKPSSFRQFHFKLLLLQNSCINESCNFDACMALILHVRVPFLVLMQNGLLFMFS